MNIRLIIATLVLGSCVACAAPNIANETPTAVNDSQLDLTPTGAAPAEATVPAITMPSTTPVPTADSITSPATVGDEFLVLRDQTLIAIGRESRAVRSILDNVTDFVLAPNATLIAVVRGVGSDAQLWVVSTDGGKILQLTDSPLAFADIAWLPDSSGIVYAASTHDSADQSSWLNWAAFCREATVYLLSIDTRKPQALGEGCNPAISPDGLRIAFATPPSRSDAQSADPDRTAGNAIRLINIKGENGWNPVSAQGSDVGTDAAGLVVYHPVWTPDSKTVLYQVFVGMRVEVDVNLLSMTDAHNGQQTLLGTFAGWGQQVSLSPDATMYAVAAQNIGDARGWSGWDVWRTDVYSLAGEREIYLPDGVFMAQGQNIGEPLWYGQHFTWMPDSTQIAVVLPPGWQPGLSPSEELAQAQNPGEVWLVDAQGQATQVIDQVDFASPITYLP